MADSCPSLDINPNRPCHQPESGTRQHCFSTPAHSSDHRLTTCALACRCVPCLPHTSPLSPRRASAILAKISWVAPTPSQAPLQIHQSYPTDAEFHASLEPLCTSPNHVLLAFPLTRLRFSGTLHRSPSISPSVIFRRLQLHLQHDSMDDQSTRTPLTSSSHAYAS